MSLNIFIDVNIFLNFYAFSNDDVKQINKLIDLIKTNRLKLYINCHVVDEFYRSRERKILEVMNSFKEIKIPKQIPRLMEHYAKISKYKDLKKNIEFIHDELIRDAMSEAINESLPADKLFRDILAASNIDTITEDITTKAIKRTKFGNPPGKPESLGDRLHWEYLIKTFPANIDLHIITDDKDYKSTFNDNQPHPVLKAEWFHLKQSKLFVYKDLSSFLIKHFPEIKISAPPEIATFVDELVETCSFASTHEAIRKIAPIINLLSKDEITKIANAANENSQISAIICDQDVNEFYKIILTMLPKEYPQNLKQELIKDIDSCDLKI